MILIQNIMHKQITKRTKQIETRDYMLLETYGSKTSTGNYKTKTQKAKPIKYETNLFNNLFFEID